MLKKTLIFCLSMSMICCASPSDDIDIEISEEIDCLKDYHTDAVIKEECKACYQQKLNFEVNNKEELWYYWLNHNNNRNICFPHVVTDEIVEPLEEEIQYTEEQELLIKVCTDGLDNEGPERNHKNLYIDCNDYYCSKNNFIVYQNICQRAN